MDITKPYEKGFFPQDILKGLKFYYELLDKVNVQIYLEENFPFKRKDVQLTITFLENIPEDSRINRHCRSHPQLTLAVESIESFSSLSSTELSNNKTNIIWFLSSLLSSGIQIIFFKTKADISQAIKDLPSNDKIKYLIENKYYYTQNEGSFPSKFIKDIVEFCDSEIEKYKEIRQSEETNQVGDEVKKMVEGYTSHIDTNKWYKQWWVISLGIGLFVAVIIGYFTQSFDWGLGVFSIVGLIIFLFNNPKRRFFRVGAGILSGIGIMNIIPGLNLQFNWTKQLPNENLEFLFKLGIEDTPWLNIPLLGLVGFLFWLDHKQK